MKAREYAISKGLAKPGRGKLSAAAHTAIKQAIADGVEIEDYANGKVVRNEPTVSRRGTSRSHDGPVGSEIREEKEEAPTEIKSRPVVHEYSTIYGVDVRGRSPIVIAFQYCSKCVVQVRYCSHETPQLPEWVGGGNGLIAQPTEEEAWEIYTNTIQKVSEKNTKPWSETKS